MGGEYVVQDDTSENFNVIRLYPKAWLSDEETLKKRSETGRLERARKVLLSWHKPVVMRDAQCGDTIIELEPGLPTICALRLHFAFAAAKVRIRGADICGNFALNTFLFPFNVCYPGRSFYLFLTQFFASLSILFVQAMLFFYFLFFYPWGENEELNFLNVTLAIWLYYSFVLFGCDAVFQFLIIPIDVIRMLISLFKNGGSVYQFWDMFNRRTNYWSCIFHWLSLSVNLPYFLKFWLVNIICYLFLIFSFIPVAYFLLDTGAWACFTIYLFSFLFKLSADVITHFYAGSISADIPLVPFVPCITATCKRTFTENLGI